jgi:hypothetical protein
MRAMDPLGERLAQLRARRRDPGWARDLLELGRELALAEAGAVLARGPQGWEALAPETTEPLPEPWVALAETAIGGRGVAAAAAGAGGRWVFAAAAGPADAPGVAPRPAALVLEVASALPMDLVLTRERMAFLGALAEAGASEALLADRAPLALAAAISEALLAAPERTRGLHEAAALLARAGLQGVQRAAILLPRRSELGLSDQAQVEPGADLPRRLMALAREAIDRGAPRLAQPGAGATPAERDYAGAIGAAPLLSVPAPGGEAVVILSFAPGSAPPAETGERLLPVATLLGGLAAGPARPGRRPRWILPAALAALLAALAFWPRAAVVEAPVLLRPERAQVVTAPFDGVLDASTAQPGDAVARNDTPLARLATREVELELAAARARAANDLRDASVARAAGQPAQEQIALLSARRAEAQVALLENRLRLADIRAPADGVIIAGDLRRSLGQPVSRGQVLFEIALPGPLRAEVLVLDEDSAALAPGQTVRFATAAEPGRVHEAVVERIRPMAEVVDGRNVFRVVAALREEDAAGLRPGMEGWARVEVGRTTWLAALLRDPVRWVRRRLWI